MDWQERMEAVDRWEGRVSVVMERLRVCAIEDVQYNGRAGEDGVTVWNTYPWTDTFVKGMDAWLDIAEYQTGVRAEQQNVKVTG